jgi:outer membrane protein
MQRIKNLPIAGAIALIFLSLQPAQAAPADPQVIQSAQRLLAAGNPKQAYMELIAAQDRMAGDVEFDYLLGVAALDSGKTDEAIIAFERVLAVNPKHAGARMDLARAYYNSGAYDLAEATFQNVKDSSPPPLALESINRYLTAIQERKKAKRAGFSAYTELGIGYDSNITGVPTDFSSAVLSAFNLAGVNPTGNSVKRHAAFLNGAAGLDYYYPLSRGWSLFAGGDVSGRAYRNESDFNSKGADARFGGALNDGAQQWRLSGTAARFDQEGEAEGDPKPTNNRKSAGISGDWRMTLDQRNQIGLNVQFNRQRFPDNNVEDFDQTLVSASWLRSFEGKGLPLLYVTGFYSNDDAVRKLPDGVADKSKRVGGLRGYLQVAMAPTVQAFGGLGFTLRKDQSPFARATQVEIGRDKLADLSLGVNWRFQTMCTLRAQWLYSRNDSNIAIYDYSRNEVSSTIRCDFE